MGARALPQILLAPLGGGGTCPPKIFTGYIMIWKVYLKRISKYGNSKNFFIMCLKFSQNFKKSLIFHISFAKLFFNFFQQIILNSYFYYNLLNWKSYTISLIATNDCTVMYSMSHCKKSVLDLTKNWWIFKSIFV